MAVQSSSEEFRSKEEDVVGPFLIGAVVGGVTAAVIALIIGEQRSGVVSGFRIKVDGRISKNNKPRFELLLQ